MIPLSIYPDNGIFIYKKLQVIYNINRSPKKRHIMSNAFLLGIPSGQIHLSAVSNFFENNPAITPESIALELEHVRECMVQASPENCHIADIKATHKLLSELIIMFREM